MMHRMARQVPASIGKPRKTSPPSEIRLHGACSSSVRRIMDGLPHDTARVLNQARKATGACSAMAVALESRQLHRNVCSMLNNRALLEVYAHARCCYPEECCGMILDSAVRPCRNVQNELHRRNPIAFPRTASEAYCFDAEDQLWLLESADSSTPVRAIYHSHPDSGAGFSETDRALALHDGRPILPRLLHLIVDCRPDHVVGARLYAFVDGDFREVARFPGRRM